MPLPSVVSVLNEGERVVGGVAIEAVVADSNDKQKRKRGERTGDKKKRACRTCTRCATNNGTNGKRCKGRHACYGAAKCEFFDAGGVKRKGKQDIDEEEDASAKKAKSSVS